MVKRLEDFGKCEECGRPAIVVLAMQHPFCQDCYKRLFEDLADLRREYNGEMS